ncbi:hypothetical protein [Limnohabitans sp.]|jgi:hypothetical protein|uniref:hypothetical protein n=1 Tax=Limnohabitans sp. TaxID=1907725 RepID=UPI00261A10E2|nr:hypothetical protein [Limnohabitans sp.]
MTGHPSTSPSACTQDAVEKEFRIVSAHLKKAHQSNELATRLHQKGFAQDAQQQSRLTKVFISNAMHHVSLRAKSLDL